MKKTRLALTALLSFLALNSICKSLTDDFSLKTLIPPASSTWTNSHDPSNLDELLSQEYFYLSKGKQAYVFASKDGKYVLKLFKHLPPSLEIPLFGRVYKLAFAKLPFMKDLTVKPLTPSYLGIRDREFQSYVNAFSMLQKETRVKYLHLSSTDHLHKTLKIYDKIGILRFIDLDSTSFLIQEKTDLLYPTLSELLKNKEEDKAKELLKNFTAFYFHLIDLNIVNPTTLEGNIGCDGLQPIQIDVGRVLRPEDLNRSEKKVPDTQIYKSTRHMQKWLAVRSPELAEYLKDLVEETLKERLAQKS